DKIVTEADIMYKVAPIINAAGRRGVPPLSINLFLAEDLEVASRILSELSAKNEERKELSKGVLDEALEQVRQIDKERVPVLYSEHWPVSIISQVAGQVSSILKRPVIILAPRLSGGNLQGSARSVRGFDLKSEVLSRTDGVVKDLGGHMEAFGLSLSRDRLDEFMDKVKGIEVTTAPVRIVVDAELTPDFVTAEFWRDMTHLGPFGPMNQPPLFLMRKATVVSAERVGGNGRHLRMILCKSGKRVLGFYQNSGERWKDVLGKTLSAIFYLSRDFSSRRLALEIQDLREDV
ncbi:MAG: DHHA1 domain-containing protein, partial [bacterium]